MQQAAITKLAVSEIVTSCIQILDAMDYVSDMLGEHYHKDAPVMEIYEGTSEVQRLIIAVNQRVQSQLKYSANVHNFLFLTETLCVQVKYFDIFSYTISKSINFIYYNFLVMIFFYMIHCHKIYLRICIKLCIHIYSSTVAALYEFQFTVSTLLVLR